VILSTLAGLAIGGFASNRERVFEQNARGGFSRLSEFAEFGTTIPPYLRHLK
jgi:hypothetical protein